LVFKEQKGACSTKQALLYKSAMENNIPNVQLILSMYRMTQKNTPALGDVIYGTGLEYIPEAHCYLKENGKRKDLTSNTSDFDQIRDDIIFETEIMPEDIVNKKVKIHQDFLREWIVENAPLVTFDEIWKLREECIRQLTLNNKK